MTQLLLMTQVAEDIPDDIRKINYALTCCPFCFDVVYLSDTSAPNEHRKELIHRELKLKLNNQLDHCMIHCSKCKATSVVLPVKNEYLWKKLKKYTCADKMLSEINCFVGSSIYCWLFDLAFIKKITNHQTDRFLVDEPIDYTLRLKYIFDKNIITIINEYAQFSDYDMMVLIDYNVSDEYYNNIELTRAQIAIMHIYNLLYIDTDSIKGNNLKKHYWDTSLLVNSYNIHEPEDSYPYGARIGTNVFMQYEYLGKLITRLY